MIIRRALVAVVYLWWRRVVCLVWLLNLLGDFIMACSRFQLELSIASSSLNALGRSICNSKPFSGRLPDMTLFILPTLIISRSFEMCDFNSTCRALIELTWLITSARGATGGGELGLLGCLVSTSCGIIAL